MAEERDDSERSQEPTLKHLDEALQRGDVAKSQEVNTWFVIAGSTLVLMAFSGSMTGAIMTALRGFIAHAHEIQLSGSAFPGVIAMLGRQMLGATAIPLLLLVLAAIGGNLVQHRLVWSTEAIMPRLARVSPLEGFKRLFSRQALVNLAKGLAKVSLIGAVLAALLWPERTRLESLVTLDPRAILPLARSLSLKLLAAVVAILAIVAALDFFYQYRQWYERQKMSLRELKEEFKQTDGDPAVKGKIRQLRASRMRKRMMAAVPTASVVVTNPTHFAVALRYERGMNAPVCVAKGLDFIARKMREVAAQHGIPIVENAPLARAMHATVEIDQEIRPEHYKAVAEIIGYVMRLNRSFARPQPRRM
jgi:flagellar biosynthetic protein FlhB